MMMKIIIMMITKTMMMMVMMMKILMITMVMMMLMIMMTATLMIMIMMMTVMTIILLLEKDCLPSVCICTTMTVGLALKTLINILTLVRELVALSMSRPTGAMVATWRVYTLVFTLHSRHHALIYI